MVAAQLLDLVTFVTMIGRVGVRAEANPFVVDVLERGGLPDLVLAKVALMVLIGAVAVCLMALGRRGSAGVGWAVLGIAIAAGVVGGWSNALTMGPL